MMRESLRLRRAKSIHRLEAGSSLRNRFVEQRFEDPVPERRLRLSSQRFGGILQRLRRRLPDLGIDVFAGLGAGAAYMLVAMRGMNSVAPQSASSRAEFHSQTKSEHFIFRMRGLFLVGELGSALAGTGFGTSAGRRAQLDLASTLLSIGWPTVIDAGRKARALQTP
jgi:hypothetical protein